MRMSPRPVVMTLDAPQPAPVTGESAGVDVPPRPLAALAYSQLRRLARFRLSRERAGHTLTPTALVHEAYLRLGGGAGRPGRDFLLAAGEAMQRILVEHARRRNAAKRGGGKVQPMAGDDLDRLPPEFDGMAAQAADLREHLAKLAAVHPEAHEVVMLRYYAGLGVEDVAAVLGVDRRTVTRRWTLAKAWLFERMNGRDEGSCTTTNDSPPPT
jgi:RNA polymerase sigma factor (TIGR02999 family)